MIDRITEKSKYRHDIAEKNIKPTQLLSTRNLKKA